MMDADKNEQGTEVIDNQMKVLATRMGSMQGSRTLAMSSRAKAMMRQGRDVINLAIGELSFDVPGNVKDAAIRAVRQGHAQSTPVAGVPLLLEAIVAKLGIENGLSFTPDQIIVGTGTKQVIYNAMLATLNEGDEVVIPAPYWVSYPEIVRMTGGVPVPVRTDPRNEYKLQASELDAVLNARSKWLILNSPNNPTGAVYCESELVALADVLRRYPSVHVLSDDIYERFVYQPSSFLNILQVAPWLADRTLTLNGVSKSHAMIGWRLGYGAGPRKLIDAMTKIQSQVTSGTSSIVQYAAIEALTGPKVEALAFVDAFRDRRAVALEMIGRIPCLPCTAAQGAFYLYPDCSAYVGRRTRDGKIIATDADLADHLLDSVGVASLPGEACGQSPALRIAYVCDEPRLVEAFERMREALLALD